MNYRHVVSVVGAAAVALVLPVLAAAPASADPVLGSTAAAMQRDLGLSPAAAAARVQSENAAALTDESLQSKLGAAYSGSYLDQSSGRLVVRTSDPAAAATIASAGAQPVVIQPKKDPKIGKDKLDRAARKAPTSVSSWYVDEVSGAVVVESTDPAAARSFVADSGATADAVQVKQVVEKPRLFLNLVGGQAITSNGGRCSIGFSAKSGTTTYVITAGHCTVALPGTWAGYNGTTIGPAVAKNFPTDDFGSIRVTNTAWVGTSQVSGTSSVLGSTAAAVGASTCRSGSTTGYRCGTIQAKNATVNYGGGDIVFGLTKTSACAEPGDSGGSFVSGRQAQGMTSGGSGNCSVGGTTYFQPVGEALSRTGTTLVVG